MFIFFQQNEKNAYKQLNFITTGNHRGDQMVSHLALYLGSNPVSD